MRLRKKILTLALVATLALSFSACSKVAIKEPELSKETVTEAKEEVLENTELEVELSPQSDFYTFMNKEWLDNAVIPSDSSSINNFTEVNDNNEKLIADLLKDLNDNYASLEAGSDNKKLIDLYNQALDFEARNKLGIEPIKEDLEKVRAISSMEDLNKLSIENFKNGYPSIIGLGVEPDLKDSSTNILYVSKPSVSLSKNYYEKDDEFSQKVRAGHRENIIDLLVLAGNTNEEASKKADLIIGLEKDLVSSILSQEEEMNREAMYNVYTLDNLVELTSNLPIIEAIKDFDLDKANKIVVLQPKALEKLNSLYTQENLEAFKAQLEYFLVSANSDMLSKDFIEANQKYSAVLTGISQLPEDKELAYNFVNSRFGDLIGKAYVEKYFPASSKEEILSMVDKIKDVYRERIKKLDWLTDETKEKALEKLDTLVVKIGYPDKWEDYSDLEIKTYEEGGNLFENNKNIVDRLVKKALATLNKEVDKTKWQRNPQEINAYYNPVFNEVVFLAGILQAPFYEADADMETKLGAIGAVIGHEISHAFDSSGAQFDASGNLNFWWTEEDYAKFSEKVKKAADIYSALEVLPGYYVNGEISTGEVMADLGGLTVVLEIAKNDKLDTKKVFEAYSHVWRDKSTEEAMISGLTDEHPPSKFRVNNIVNLIDDFYTDFDVKEGDAMYVKPEDRLKVW